MIAENKFRRTHTMSPRPKSLRVVNGSSRPAALPRTVIAPAPGTRVRYAAGRASAAPAPARAEATAVRRRTSLLTFRIPAAKMHRDSVLTGTLIACAAVVCILGICYLGVFANVQYLSFELHSEQAKLSTATAKQHELIDRIGRLSSPDLIASQASGMNMELPTMHAFVDVPAGAPIGAPQATVMAAAN